MKILDKLKQKKHYFILIDIQEGKAKIDVYFKIRSGLESIKYENKTYPINSQFFFIELDGVKFYIYKKDSIEPIQLNQPAECEITPELLDKLYLPKLIQEFNSKAQKEFKWKEFIFGLLAGGGFCLFIGSTFLGGL